MPIHFGRFRKAFLGLVLTICTVGILPVATAEDVPADGDGIIESGEVQEEELRRAAQNPMAKMISFPIQNNTFFDWGPEKKTFSVTNIQPVVPFQLNDDWLLISRTIVPIIYQPELYDGQGSEFGLGDINQALFIGPAEPGKIIWGAGPIFMLPTATDKRLGADKWGAGPAAVALTMRGPWVFGTLAQNIWSFADAGGGKDREGFNQFLIQPFVNYNLPNGWYVSSSPVITANWKADSDDRWIVPVGGGVGKIFTMGKTPVNASLNAYYNVEKPDTMNSDWQLRFQVQFLFPKGRN